MEKLSKFKFSILFILFFVIDSLFAESSNAVNIKEIILGVLFVFVILVAIIAIFAFCNSLKDKIMVKKQIKTLLSKEIKFTKKSNRTTGKRKIKISFSFKIIVFTLSIVILVICSISIPLSIIILNDQEESLAAGLQRRVTVLMESISRGAKVYMPSQNDLELKLLTIQSDTMVEAKNITILGFPKDKDKTKTIDYVWASNNPIIDTLIDTEVLIPGESRIVNPILLQIAEKILELNNNKTYNVQKTLRQISELGAEYTSLVSQNSDDNKKQDLYALIRELNTKLEIELHQIAKENLSSIPPTNAKTLDRTNANYLFYQPILFRQPGEENFVHGLVIIEVNTENLINSLYETRKDVAVSTLIISLIVVLMGIIISSNLSFYIVKDLKSLAKHVETIKHTENKAELLNKKIFSKSNDEFGVLCTNINEMTEFLGQAAIYESMLLGGKEVQRSFLPLDTANKETKAKLSVGHIETENVQFFGYYEGAKGVSGDFFDFRNLDERFFALIKCDVSGKGAPAALIMAEVSALFCDYFKNWSYAKDGVNLQNLVYKINDHLESRNLKGKFAAFTLAIFDTIQGDLYFCNAGDNMIRIYDESEKKQKVITLPSTPAAGIFPSSLIELKGGFPTVKVHLDKNDILFLYTDGIEDSKRFFRNSENEILKFIPNSNKMIEDQNDNNAICSEDFGTERVEQIIDAVFSKEKYRLIKKQNPIENKDMKLLFDFSTLEGTPEDFIMALVSVEKIFRLYQTYTIIDQGVVDKKIDNFLELHFNKYDTICNAKIEHPNPDLKDEYIIYTAIKEEEQTDDLTLLAIKKK